MWPEKLTAQFSDEHPLPFHMEDPPPGFQISNEVDWCRGGGAQRCRGAGVQGYRGAGMEEWIRVEEWKSGGVNGLME